MDTKEHQKRNTLTYQQVMERANTSGIFDNKLFDENNDIYFPTQFVNESRSFTINTSHNNVPKYDSEIYEFYYHEIKTKMKEFILNNPNLWCLVKIKKPQKKDNYFHSQVWLHEFRYPNS